MTFTDAFDRPVTKGTTTELEQASHYPYNTERWRVLVNGTRQFIEYGSVAQYSHDGHNHELNPAAGETVTLRTAERPRYTVQSEMAVTWAFKASQALQTGDRLRIGLYDGTDGWFFEKNDTHAELEADLVILNQGTEQLRETVEDIKAPVTQFARLLLRTGWYDVTRQIWERSYPNEIDSEQDNPEIARTGLPDKRGPHVGNLPLQFEVTAGVGTSNLTLEAGSCSLVTYSEASDRFREKTHSFEYTFVSGDVGSWVPIHAFRVDPDRKITNVQISNTDIVQFSGSGDVRMMPMSVAPSKTDASSFSAPKEHNPTNSVVQTAGTRTSPSVTTFPDSTGTEGTSAANPGGYQLGYGSWYSSGTGSKSNVASGGKTRKRALPNGDICVVIANASTTGDITAEIITQQDF